MRRTRCVTSMSASPITGLIGVLEEQRPELRRFLVARTGNESDADDVLNELWIKVSSGRSGPITNPKSYLFRMASNLVLDRLRETRRRERREAQWNAERYDRYASGIEVADATPNAEQWLLDQEEVQRLADAISRLPPGAQQVLRLHKLEGLSHGEVAERLGISKSAVEKHMAVAMTHLRRTLAAEAVGAPRRLSDNEGGSSVTGTGSKT